MLHKLQKSLRKRFFPTDRDRAIRRWRADKGDATLRLSYPLDQDSIVYDLGGYEGEWAADVFKRYGSRIEIFEPVPDFAAKIGLRFQNQSRLRVHALGLAGHSGTEELALDADESSLFRSTHGSPRVKIELIDVADWFAREKVSRIDLMKINIEGGEYELLERMLETGLTARVDHFQIQFHNLAENSRVRMDRILAGLASTHESTYSYPFVWEGLRLRH